MLTYQEATDKMILQTQVKIPETLPKKDDSQELKRKVIGLNPHLAKTLQQNRQIFLKPN